jgi:hypothetical protein
MHSLARFKSSTYSAAIDGAFSIYTRNTAMKFVGLLLMVPLAAHAVSFEVGIGSSNYTTAGDGRWYQLGLPHVLNTKTYGFSAGLTGELYSVNSSGIDWHADYVHLGHVSSTCACTPVDENYDLGSKTLITKVGYNAPLAQFVGNGNVQGIALTVAPWTRIQGWKLSAEGGLFIYRPRWNVNVYNWQVDQNTAPQTLHVHTPQNLQPGFVIGVGVGRGPFTVSLKHYFMPGWVGDKTSPPIYKGATVVDVKYRF